VSGERPTAAELLQTVHAQLRRIAAQQMGRERSDHTLQATALVHEAWVSLRDRVAGLAEDPGLFYRAAAESMRRILIDHARRRNASKRGGDMQRLSLDVVEVASTANLDQVLAIDEAIAALEQVSRRAAELVRLRFFAGLEEVEAARTLEISERTARREWAFARAWLFRRLSGAEPPAEPS